MHAIQHNSDTDYQRIIEAARYHIAWRAALRRLTAYLAVRWDPAWIDASVDVLDGYLPVYWQTLAHHELVTYLDVQGITPEHCTML